MFGKNYWQKFDGNYPGSKILTLMDNIEIVESGKKGDYRYFMPYSGIVQDYTIFVDGDSRPHALGHSHRLSQSESSSISFGINLLA